METSTRPMVGAQRRSYNCGYLQINPDFLDSMGLSLRSSIGVLLASLPTFLNWSRRGFMSDLAKLDLAYAAMMYLFVSGRSLGETIKLIWQATIGSVTAAFAPILVVDTFSPTTADCEWSCWFGIGVFIFFYSCVVLALPTEPLVKKFAMGICVNYLMYEANPLNLLPENKTSVWATLHLVLLGLWGCLIAIICVMFSPTLGLAQARAQLEAQRAVDTVNRVVRLLLHGYCEGLTTLDRTRLVKHFADMERSIASMQQSLDEAWYEAFLIPGTLPKVARWNSVLDMVYKLRAELYGMQKALCDEEDKYYAQMQRPWQHEGKPGEDFDVEWHNAVMDKLREPSANVVVESLHLFTKVVSLITTENARLYDPTDANTIEPILDSKSPGHSLARARIKQKIEARLGGQDDAANSLLIVQNAVNLLHLNFAQLREERKLQQKDNTVHRNERVEYDDVLIMFLFGLSGFAQQLLDFPQEYAHTMEEAANRSGWCQSESKMIALQFQRKHIVAALKTAISVTFAASVNALILDHEVLGPVLVSYLMAGQVGSSWANTTSRILGLLSGAILAVCFLIFSECNEYILPIGYGLIVFFASYLRYTSPQQSYTGLVVAVSASAVLVRECTEELSEQYGLVRQIILTCIALALGELVFWPVSGSKNLQKKLSDTFTECKTAFHQLSHHYVATYVANLAEAETIDNRKVEKTLWAVIPAYLHDQNMFLQHAKHEPTLHRVAFPTSAYARVVDANMNISIHLMLLRNAWKRLAELANDKGYDELMMDRNHLQREPLDVANPHRRLVEVTVQVKMGGKYGNIQQIKDILMKEGGAIDVKDWKATELIAVFPANVYENANHRAGTAKNPCACKRCVVQRLMEKKYIALNMADAKVMAENGETTYHVSVHKMFADSQEQLLRPAIKTTIALSMKSIDIQACRGCSKAECRQCRKRTEFQETFKKDLARLADVTPDEIKIISIVAGSIIVKAEIIGEGASEKVALLERMLAMERSPPKIAGSAVEMTVIANTDGFEYSRLKKTVAVIKFDSVDRAVKRVKWLLSLGRDSVSEKWEPVHGDLERNALRHMIKDELSFKFRQGNLMDQVGILSAQVKECFQEVAGTLRREDVTDKEMLHLEPRRRPNEHAFFQTPKDYEDNRLKHVSTALRSELDELMHRFHYALKAAIHIPKADNMPLPHEDLGPWIRSNEDLMVCYGVCRNYQSLVEGLLEVDSVMFNGDDDSFIRTPVMLHSHAWTARELASQFVPAGHGPSWYKLHHDSNSEIN